MKTQEIAKIESVFTKIPAQKVNSQVFFTDNICPKTKHDSFSPCFGSFYSIAYCKKGHYDIQIDGENYRLKPGSILIFRPGEYLHFLNAHNYFGYLISFTEDFFGSIRSVKDYEKEFSFLKRGRPNLLEIDYNINNHFEDYFKGYGRIVSASNQPYRIEIIRSVLNSMFYEIEALYLENETCDKQYVSSPRKMSVLESFKDILEFHFKQHWSVKFYADKLCITPDYLGKIVRRTCGKTAVDLINERRLMEAKLLLKSSDNAIFQISEELHFSSSTVFSRFFLKLAGITPLNYRKMNK